LNDAGPEGPVEEYTSVNDQQIMPWPAGGRRAEGSTGVGKDDDESGGRGDRITVGSGDENVAKIQLAARWVEQFAPENDTLDGALQRFHRAYYYIDSVSKLVDPTESQ
jgi:hypothetical protein